MEHQVIEGVSRADTRCGYKLNQTGRPDGDAKQNTLKGGERRSVSELVTSESRASGDVTLARINVF